jgi:3D (Asp-Asp-Asp) domain-containing protein
VILIKKLAQISCLLVLLCAVLVIRHNSIVKQEIAFQAERKEAVKYFDQILAERNQQIKEESARKAAEEKARQKISNSRSSSTKRPQVNYQHTPGEYLGWFTSTAYCIENYHHICNDGDATTTAMGTRPIPYQTIAVDPKVIPLGTKLVIKDSYGNTYHVLATDTGGAIKGNKIDMVCPTHNDANNWGRRPVEIWIAK